MINLELDCIVSIKDKERAKKMRLFSFDNSKK